jgi:hypothetical protein
MLFKLFYISFWDFDFRVHIFQLYKIGVKLVLESCNKLTCEEGRKTRELAKAHFNAGLMMIASSRKGI